MAIMIRHAVRTGALVLVVAGSATARVAGKMGGYSNKKGGAEQKEKTPETLSENEVTARAGDVMERGGSREQEKSLRRSREQKSRKSTSGINEEIIWISISMAIAIAVLIAIALCYILKEKCMKRKAYREQS